MNEVIQNLAKWEMLRVPVVPTYGANFLAVTQQVYISFF